MALYILSFSVQLQVILSFQLFQSIKILGPRPPCMQGTASPLNCTVCQVKNSVYCCPTSKSLVAIFKKRQPRHLVSTLVSCSAGLNAMLFSPSTFCQNRHCWGKKNFTTLLTNRPIDWLKIAARSCDTDATSSNRSLKKLDGTSQSSLNTSLGRPC